MRWPWIPHVRCPSHAAYLLTLLSGKTNAAGYELYGLVGELNGQAVPLAFCFTASTDGTALDGAKDRLLRTVIRFVSNKCPNIDFTLSDKDLTEINGFQTEIPHARHQLCYWHGVRYIEERLSQNKPPAKYSAIQANQVFNFIDPTLTREHIFQLKKYIMVLCRICISIVS